MREDRRSLDLGTSMPSPQPPSAEAEREVHLPVPVTPTPSRIVRTAPPGVILPDRGLPKARYDVNVRLGRPDRVPNITSAQQRDVWKDEIRDIMDAGTRAVISVANSKSGSKTRTALGLAQQIARNSSKFVLVVPATKNTATATQARMAGVAVTSETLTMRKFAQHPERYRTYGALSQYVPRVRLGNQLPSYGIIAGDLTSSVATGGNYTVELFMQIVRTIYPNVDVLILDHGNDDIEESSFGTAAIRMSDVVVMPAREPDPISLETLTDSFRGYQDDAFQGFTAEDIAARKLKFIHELGYGDDEVLLPGELIATPDKMRRSTLVMSASKRFDHRQFEQLTWPIGSAAKTSQPPQWSGEGVVVPFEKSFTKKGVVVASDPANIAQSTDDAYLQLAVTVLRDAVNAQNMAERAWSSVEQRLRELRDDTTSLRQVGRPEEASGPSRWDVPSHHDAHHSA